MLIPAHQFLLEAQDSYQLEVALEPVEPLIYRVQQIKRDLARERASVPAVPVSKVVVEDPAAPRPPSLYRPKSQQSRPQRAINTSSVPAEQPPQPF
jgi:hypothetical protein